VLWLAEWETVTDTLVEGETLWLAEWETRTDTLFGLSEMEKKQMSNYNDVKTSAKVTQLLTSY